MSEASVTVQSGARLHFGFRNLARTRERIFGGIGVGISEPTVRVTVTPAGDIDSEHERALVFAKRAVSELGVQGASITVEEELPEHVGLGSGTQLALATLLAIATAYGCPAHVRELAPALGRGRRSGVGIATFERGGLTVDDGHPTEDVLESIREPGAWTTPAVVHQKDVPERWRFVLIIPDVPPGKHGDEERDSIRAAIQSASEKTSQQIEQLLTRKLLPAVDAVDVETFGEAISRIDALNGSWFEAEEGIPAQRLIDILHADRAIFGAGQSSWGALVYGLTVAERAHAAEQAGHRALTELGLTGEVSVVSPRNRGATISYSDSGKRDVHPSADGGTT